MLSGTILLLAAAPAHALTKVAVLGPGDPWVSLNAAKTAHKQGLTSSVACNKPAEARKMLWGADLSSEDEAKIKVVEGAEGIGEILEDAEGLIISGAGFAGLTGNYCETVLRNAPACTSVAICVEAGKNADAIDAARKACAERSIPCSVLRVHELRGGGPGTNKGEEMEDLGLSRQFYDTQFDFPKFQADEYADKFLLGVSVRTRRPRTESFTPSTRSPTQAQAGDKPVNFFQKMKAANGIQRDDGITNRAVVGRALVAALTCEPVDLTMNVEEGLRPVLVEDWAAWFANPTKISGELN
jgi:hypothetical protein